VHSAHQPSGFSSKIFKDLLLLVSTRFCSYINKILILYPLGSYLSPVPQQQIINSMAQSLPPIDITAAIAALDDVPSFIKERFGPTWQAWKDVMIRSIKESNGEFHLQHYAELWFEALEVKEREIQGVVEQAREEGYRRGFAKGKEVKALSQHEGKSIQYSSPTHKPTTITVTAQTVGSIPGIVTSLPFASISTHAEPLCESPTPSFTPHIESAATPRTERVSWADDISDIAIDAKLITPHFHSRDISVLRSLTLKKPFGSLQRRHMQNHTAKSENSSKSHYVHSMLPHRRQNEPKIILNSTPPQSHSTQSRTSTHSRPSSRSNRGKSRLNLSLLVLSDVAKALGQMGWRPPRYG
jgi:hypothetical protein